MADVTRGKMHYWRIGKLVLKLNEGVGVTLGDGDDAASGISIASAPGTLDHLADRLREVAAEDFRGAIRPVTVTERDRDLQTTRDARALCGDNHQPHELKPGEDRFANLDLCDWCTGIYDALSQATRPEPTVRDEEWGTSEDVARAVLALAVNGAPDGCVGAAARLIRDYGQRGFDAGQIQKYIPISGEEPVWLQSETSGADGPLVGEGDDDPPAGGKPAPTTAPDARELPKGFLAETRRRVEHQKECHARYTSAQEEMAHVAAGFALEKARASVAERVPTLLDALTTRGPTQEQSDFVADAIESGKPDMSQRISVSESRPAGVIGGTLAAWNARESTDLAEPLEPPSIPSAGPVTWEDHVAHGPPWEWLFKGGGRYSCSRCGIDEQAGPQPTGKEGEEP